MNATTQDWHPNDSTNQTALKWVLRFSLWTQAKSGVTQKEKTKTNAREIFHPFAGTPHWGYRFEFGMRGNVADGIILAKFCGNRFSGFGVLIPPILPFSIGIAVALTTV